MMWDLMLPDCFSCFTIVSNEWERVIGGAGSGKDLLRGGMGGIYVCVTEKESRRGTRGKREKGSAVYV